MKTSLLKILLVTMGILSLSGSIYASGVPSQASTQLRLQNNSSGTLKIDKASAALINIQGSKFTGDDGDLQSGCNSPLPRSTQ